MKKFTLCDDFLALFPDACFGILVANGVSNVAEDTAVYETMLREAEKQAKVHVREEEFSENPVVAEWRAAYRKFKTKKGARCSVEALLKRAQTGNQLNTISPVVDLYNCISLKYGFPAGGEDIDTFEGDLRLTMANGDEEFYLIGSEENEPPYQGEVVYKDNAGAVCRCFNWREAKRTMLTEDSKNMFLIIEAVNHDRMEALQTAMSELAANVEKYTGATVRQTIVDKNNPETIIEE